MLGICLVYNSNLVHTIVNVALVFQCKCHWHSVISPMIVQNKNCVQHLTQTDQFVIFITINLLSN